MLRQFSSPTPPKHPLFDSATLIFPGPVATTTTLLRVSPDPGARWRLDSPHNWILPDPGRALAMLKAEVDGYAHLNGTLFNPGGLGDAKIDTTNDNLYELAKYLGIEINESSSTTLTLQPLPHGIKMTLSSYEKSRWVEVELPAQSKGGMAEKTIHFLDNILDGVRALAVQWRALTPKEFPFRTGIESSSPKSCFFFYDPVPATIHQPNNLINILNQMAVPRYLGRVAPFPSQFQTDNTWFAGLAHPLRCIMTAQLGQPVKVVVT